MQKLKDLQDKRLELANKLKEFNSAENAKTDGTSWNAEATAAWDAMNADYDKVVADLGKENENLQKAAERTNRLKDIDNYRDPIHNKIGRDGGTIHEGPKHTNSFGAAVDSQDIQATALQGWFLNHSDEGEVTEAHHEAARQLGFNLSKKMLTIQLPKNFERVRDGFRRGDIRNALSSQDGSSGGYTFGDTFVGNLERAMLAFGGMMQVAEIIRTSSGEPMRWPTADDTSNTGAQLGENTSIGSSVDPSFGQVIWNAYKFSSKPILVPFELIRDNAANLLSVLPDMLGERLGRIQNTKYTTGTGAGTAKGITVCASAGVTAASATAIAFDELIDLEHSLDPSRRRLAGVGYMFHDTILKALRKLKDGEGRYLWQAGANSGAPDTLNTYPYTVNQDMQSSIATGTITVLFGQLSAYKIRQVNSVRFYRLQERYRDTDQDGFIAFMEGDGNLLNAGDNPVKKLTQA